MTNRNTLKLLFEDDNLLAFEKPAGLAAVAAPNIPPYKTLVGWVRAWVVTHGKEFKPYPLHRLDRDTSGVMLFGKFPRDREKLEAIFGAPETEKTYLALVKWVPKKDEDTISIPLEARTARIKVPAITHYKVLKKLDNISLLEVRIETGRKHQIRKHLSMIGNPLLLDHLYGDRNFDMHYQRKHKGRGKFFLHAAAITFKHPFTGEMVKIVSEAPDPCL